MNIEISADIRTDYDDDGDPPDVEWGNRDTEHHSLEGLTARVSDRTDEQSIRGMGGRGDSALVGLDVEPGDDIFVVVARYSSGDTFGSSDGHVAIFDAFKTYDEAWKLQRAVAGTNNQERTGAIDKSFYLSYDGRKYWLPWVGYFENFERCEVIRVMVTR